MKREPRIRLCPKTRRPGQGHTLAVIAAISATAMSVRTHAQSCSPHWTHSDNVPGVAGTVSSITPLSGGDVIVGGSFDVAGSVLAANVARYSPATGSWTALGSGVVHSSTIATVTVVRELAGGDLLVGGKFTAAGGVQAANIARYSFGTDTWSAIGSGTAQGGGDGTPHVFHPLGDGRLLVGGEFTNAGGVPANRLAILNPSDNTWSAYSIGITNGFMGITINGITPLSGGDLLLWGAFNNTDHGQANNIVRYSPATDTMSPLGSGTNGPITAVYGLPDGSFLLGGTFSTAGGGSTNNIARYDPATGVWSAVGAGATVTSGTPAVSSLTLMGNGKIAVTGSFVFAGGMQSIGLAELDPSTLAWTARPPAGQALCAASTASGDLLVGGVMGSIANTGVRGIARYRPSTATWSPLSTGTNGEIVTLASLPGGDVLAGGFFTSAGGQPCNFIGRYSPMPGLWAPLGTGANGAVMAAAARPSGDVVVGGGFSTINGVAAGRIANFHPQDSTWSPLGTGLDGVVNAIIVLANGDIVAGGTFTTAGGSPASRVARYNPQSDSWTALGTGIASTVYTMCELPNGDLVAGGFFASAGSFSTRNVARFDNGSGTWLPLGTGTIGTVYAVAARTDGTIVAGGSFTSAGGVAASGIARFDPQAGTWSALGTGTPTVVYGLARVANGDLLASGYGGASRVARLSAATGNWMPLATTSNSAIKCISVLPGGDVLVGGSFTVFDGGVAAYLARRTTNGTCPADFDCSGAPAIGDIFEYLNAWLALDSRADINGVDGITVQDIFDFLDAWFAGC